MNYKKYSLEQLENWMHDAMSADEATPQEIYDVIVGVVKDNYYTYKKQASEAYELLALLNGNGGWTVEDVMKEKEYYEGYDSKEKVLSCDRDDPSPECKGAWNDFWKKVDVVDSPPVYVSEDGDVFVKDYPTKKEDKVVKWQLPIEVDGPSGEYFVMFPDDLLEAAGLKEGDTVNWIDRGDGSFELRKVNGTK